MANSWAEPEWTRGERMRKLRRSAGIKSQEMADFLGVSRGTINNWESDSVAAPLGQLTAWAWHCSRSPGACYFVDDPEIAVEWMRYGVIDLSDKAKRTRTCNDPYGSSDLRLFDPDGSARVVELKDARVGNLAHNGSVGLLAKTG